MSVLVMMPSSKAHHFTFVSLPCRHNDPVGCDPVGDLDDLSRDIIDLHEVNEGLGADFTGKRFVLIARVDYDRPHARRSGGSSSDWHLLAQEMH